MEDRIRKAVQDALKTLGVEEVSFAIEWPTELSHGDYATNVAMAGAKALGKNPKEFAEELAPLIKESLAGFAEKVEIAGPGFINITLAHEVISGMVTGVGELGKDWGRTSETEGKRYIIEYSCPNPFKEMHIGHMMSTIIGEALARTVENGGAHVTRDSYGGDVGPHVAKALWGLRDKGIVEPATAKEIGDAYAHGSTAYEENEKAKTEIDALNQAIYKGEDHELMELWRKGREISLEAFQNLYRILDTHFDYFFFESETAGPGMEMVNDGLERGVFKESEGAIIYDGEKKGLHTLVFVTSKGTPTYEAKDLGLAVIKEQRCPSDVSIIITASEQIGHFKVFLSALEDIAPLIAKKTTHVPHGFLRLTSGKMSSREGNVITATGLIKEMIEKAQEKNEDLAVAEQVALGAIKYMILRQAAGGDIIFNEEKSLSLEGDSGPYLQYALVRSKKILSYASESENGDATPDAPYDIERLIIRFPEVVARAAKDYAPHQITQYLTKLAGEWNSFYASEQVLGSEEEAYKQRVAKAFATTMENGLRLLAIPTPERM